MKLKLIFFKYNLQAKLPVYQLEYVMRSVQEAPDLTADVLSVCLR